MEKYNPKKIEKKWQKEWEDARLFEAKDKSKKPKYYVLVEFPYPSGDGLHIGHCRGYFALDVLARLKRMKGLNVLFPMGWDAFGLPTENYAIKTGIHPSVVTKKNTANFKRQEKSLGLSFDWSREINTTDPEYYKWTQWIFLQFFKNGLAYKAKMPINWCPSCKIGLANEETVSGKCERCGGEVVRKEKEQWMLKITKYAERLIEDLSKVDYLEKIKIGQKEWIGRSEGWEVKFQISNVKCQIEVFTTRIDTIFGCDYVVLAPENPLIEKLKDKIENYSHVVSYCQEAKDKLERDWSKIEGEKTGIELKGIKAINPANGKEIPVFAADYVLANYGTGAVMAVPAHDQRDFEFARKYDLPIIEVIKPENNFAESQDSAGNFTKAFEEEGILVNSGKFDGMKSKLAKERIGQWLAQNNLAKKSVNYKLRDWIFSRQRYWGEPIPMIYCEKCGWQAVPEKDLPVKLPNIKNYKPSETGESPLAKVLRWVRVKCPNCRGRARRETDVMPNWAGSNWYYLAYLMRGISNFQFPISKYKEKFKYWMPVDWYNGGMEHTTLHLLYSRFVFKFLWDIGAVPKEIGSEPYKKRTSQGMVLGQGGIKMSKSKGNVVNPDEVVKKYGADCLRVYEMFMGPFDQAIPWDEKGLVGAKRFLEKVWKLQFKLNYESRIMNHELDALIQKTIKKVSEDMENLKLNTAVSSLMILVNEMDKQKELFRVQYSEFLILLSPFAPHLAEEIWSRLPGKKGFCCQQKWPEFNKFLVGEEKTAILIEINGRVRGKIELEGEANEEKVRKIALSEEKIKPWLAGKEIKKVIFIPKKLINFVI